MVPEEITFPSACCVGIASQTSLNIFNPNERWMQVNIGVFSIAINGEKVSDAAHISYNLIFRFSKYLNCVCMCVCARAIFLRTVLYHDVSTYQGLTSEWENWGL